MNFLQQNKPVVLVASLLAILIGLAILTRPLWKSKPRISTEQPSAVGQVLAEETAKLLGGRGEVVLVLWETKKKADPSALANKNSFLKTAKERGLTVANPETFSQSGGTPLTAESFLNLIQLHKNAAAIVFFTGLPTLQETDYEKVTQPSPKIIVLMEAWPLETARIYVEKGLVQMLIVSRSTPPQGSSMPTTARERFDRNYQIVTPKDLNSSNPPVAQ